MVFACNQQTSTKSVVNSRRRDVMMLICRQNDGEINKVCVSLWLTSGHCSSDWQPLLMVVPAWSLLAPQMAIAVASSPPSQAHTLSPSVSHFHTAHFPNFVVLFLHFLEISFLSWLLSNLDGTCLPSGPTGCSSGWSAQPDLLFSPLLLCAPYHSASSPRLFASLPHCSDRPAVFGRWSGHSCSALHCFSSSSAFVVFHRGPCWMRRRRSDKHRNHLFLNRVYCGGLRRIPSSLSLGRSALNHLRRNHPVQNLQSLRIGASPDAFLGRDRVCLGLIVSNQIRRGVLGLLAFAAASAHDRIIKFRA